MEIPTSPLVRNVSNSEVTTFLSCKRQYDYNFILELEPKATQDPLARGSVFHLAMEFYWKARMAGHPHEQSMTYAERAFMELPEGTTISVAMNAQFLWVRYMNYHKGFPEWEPLGTENKLELNLTPTLTMVIRYDFYFKHIPTGKCYILDYKLAYEFWKQDDHDLNGQMPKYVAVMQANGFKVDGGYLEEIRTRELGKEKASDPKNLWRRTRYLPSAPKKQAVMRQHIAAALQIEKHRALSPEERALESLPVLNKHGVCKFCNYKDLCIAELEGKKDLSVDIRHGYRQNSYVQQYNPEGPSNGLDF